MVFSTCRCVMCVFVNWSCLAHNVLVHIYVLFKEIVIHVVNMYFVYCVYFERTSYWHYYISFSSLRRPFFFVKWPSEFLLPILYAHIHFYINCWYVLLFRCAIFLCMPMNGLWDGHAHTLIHISKSKRQCICQSYCVPLRHWFQFNVWWTGVIWFVAAGFFSAASFRLRKKRNKMNVCHLSICQMQKTCIKTLASSNHTTVVTQFCYRLIAIIHVHMFHFWMVNPISQSRPHQIIICFPRKCYLFFSIRLLLITSLILYRELV